MKLRFTIRDLLWLAWRPSALFAFTPQALHTKARGWSRPATYPGKQNHSPRLLRSSYINAAII
jgi:hypothetical protein